MPSPDRQSLFRQMGWKKSLFDSTVQTAIQQHVVEHAEHNKVQKKLWSSTAPGSDLDVLTCVLPLGTVSSGRESEVESAHLFLTIIQFLSACHLTSQHTSTCIHNSIISHSRTHYKSPVLFFVLFLLWFNVPVNNFSVMLRRSHLFLGITSTFWGVNVSCSRKQTHRPGRGSNPGLPIRNPTL